MLVPELTAVLQIVSALRWSTFTVIYNGGETEERWDTRRLQNKGVSHPMVSWSALAAQMALNGSRGHCLPPGNTAFLVLGHDDFVLDVFSKVAGCTEKRSENYRLFSSEWITVSSHQNRSRLLAVAQSFELFALVSYVETGDLSLWSLRHEGIDSRLSFVASLPARGPALTRDRILPNPSHGLGGRTLRVAIKPWDSVVTIRREGGQDVYGGIVMDIFNTLAHTLNFSYTVIPLVDDKWGEELDNGQWNGVFGMLDRKEVDMAVGFFTISAKRSRVADPTTAYLYDNTAIVFRTPAADSSNWTFFVKPFQSAVYVFLAMTLVSVLMLLLLLDTCQEILHGSDMIAGGDERIARREFSWTERLGRVGVNVEILLAGLVNRACSQTSASRGGRVLVVTWLMLGVVLTSLYSSQLTSTLTAGETPLPFTSLAELLQQDTYKFGVAAGTAQYALLQTSKVKEYQQFFQTILELSKSDPDVLSANISVQREKTLQESYASLQGSRLLFSSWQRESCDQLTVLPEKISTTALGFYLQRGSPFTQAVSERINHIVDSGQVEHWKETRNRRSGHCPLVEEEEGEEGRSARGVGLADTYTAFCLAAAGLGVAATALGAERLAEMYRDRSLCAGRGRDGSGGGATGRDVQGQVAVCWAWPRRLWGRSD